MTDTQSTSDSDPEKNEQSSADTPSENDTRRQEGTMGANNQPPQPEASEKYTRRTLLHRGVTLAGGFTLGTAIASTPANAQREIDGCTVITNPGTYVLTQDIEHDGTGQECIRIKAGHVTLDGQGHTITNSQQGTDKGIHVENFPNFLHDVTVKNVGVSGFQNGVVVQRAEESDIQTVTVSGNQDAGIFVNNSPGFVIRGNTVTGNHNDGISTRGIGIAIEGNRVSDNGLRGIYVRDYSERTRVHGNRVTGHRGSGYPGVDGNPGIELDEATGPESDNTVTSNIVRGNSIGILLKGTRRNTVGPTNVIEFNTAGIRLQEHATENTVRENHIATGALVGGIDLVESDANLVEANVITGTDGIDISMSEENMVRENELSGGIKITDSESNTLFDNDIQQADITRSTGTLMLGNRLIDSQGVQISESRDTLVQGNEISGASVIGRSGVRAIDSVRTEIWSNGIRDNTVGVQISVSGAETTTIAANNLVGNSEYGIKNELEAVVDGRFNFWGARNGPSSPPDPDAPFEDPVTGRLANGDGDAVSKSPKPAPVGEGVSNVRFDPWSRVQQAVVVIPRFNPPIPIRPPSPIKPPFLPPLELTESETEASDYGR